MGCFDVVQNEPQRLADPGLSLGSDQMKRTERAQAPALYQVGIHDRCGVFFPHTADGLHLEMKGHSLRETD